MRWWMWMLAVAAALWLLDRLLIWCELRGWIYYRLSPRPVRQSLGNMMMSVEQFYRPSKQHAIELMMDGAVKRKDDGAAAGADPHDSGPDAEAEAASTSTPVSVEPRP